MKVIAKFHFPGTSPFTPLTQLPLQGQGKKRQYTLSMMLGEPRPQYFGRF
jgi:hypothetical protein